MTEIISGSSPGVPAEIDAAIAGWMESQGWDVAAARWHMDPDGGFHIWQEDTPTAGGLHALWVSELLVRRLSAEQLIDALNTEDVATEIRISLRIRIQERGNGYRVSVVSRRSGEWKKPE